MERKQSVVTPERSDQATSLTWLQELGFAVLWDSVHARRRRRACARLRASPLPVAGSPASSALPGAAQYKAIAA